MQTPPRIELLEPRIAPANVIATLRGGILQIVPDDPNAEAVLDLRQTGPNSFDLYDSQAASEPLQHFTGVKAINATLSGQDDTMTISLGEDLPAFRGSITVNAGAGNDLLWVGGGGALAGNLTFKTTGSGSVDIGNATAIHGKTVLSAAGGVAQLYSDFGAVSVSGFSNVEFGAFAEIRGQANVTAPALVEMWVTAQGPYTHFHKGLTVVGSAGNDHVDVRGTVDGNLTLRLGDGDNSLLLGGGATGFADPTLHGRLNYLGGSGADTVTVSEEVILGSAVRILAGDGENSFDLSAAGDLRSLLYRGGAGHDVFTLGEAGGESLRARVSLGDGNDEATVLAAQVLDLRIDGGAQGSDPDEADILHAIAEIAGMTALRFESVVTFP